MTMDAKSDEEEKVLTNAVEASRKEHSKSSKQEENEPAEPVPPHINKEHKERIVKPFDYSSKNEPIKPKEDFKKQKPNDDKIKSKSNINEFDLNPPLPANVLITSTGHSKDNALKFRPNIKKDSIKLK